MSSHERNGRVEEAIRRALIEGEPVTLDGLGGERAIAEEAASLAQSCVFGDLTEAVVAAWGSLSNREVALALFVEGVRANEDHSALSHALDAMSAVPPAHLRPIVRALDGRVRNAASSALARVEAAASLLRFALAEDRWRAIAIASIHALEDVQDEHAGPMVCRLASLAYEQFRDRGSLELLERLSTVAGTASQATFERGLAHVVDALDAPDLQAISAGLRHAQEWMKRACDMAEDRRDAQAYLLLTELLVPVAEGRRIDDEDIAKKLQEQVTLHILWDRPTASAEWLLPPHGAELEWIPLADSLARVAPHLTEPSWLDAERILADVVNVYSATRSVRPALERVVRPAIEAAFVRERGLLAHLDQWISQSGKERLDQHDAEVLRNNIRRTAEAPPGKPSRNVRTGRGVSSRKSPPD